MHTRYMPWVICSCYDWPWYEKHEIFLGWLEWYIGKRSLYVNCKSCCLHDQGCCFHQYISLNTLKIAYSCHNMYYFLYQSIPKIFNSVLNTTWLRRMSRGSRRLVRMQCTCSTGTNATTGERTAGFWTSSLWIQRATLTTFSSTVACEGRMYRSTCRCASALLFSKWNQLFSGRFDPDTLHRSGVVIPTLSRSWKVHETVKTTVHEKHRTEPAKTPANFIYHHPSASVPPFQNLHELFFGYFDPENIFFR